MTGNLTSNSRGKSWAVTLVRRCFVEQLQFRCFSGQTNCYPAFSFVFFGSHFLDKEVTTIWKTRCARRRDDAISATTKPTSQFGTVVGAVQEHQSSKNLTTLFSVEQQMNNGMRDISTTVYDEFFSKSMKELSVSKLSYFVRISVKKSFNKTFCHLKRNLPALY